MHPSTAEHRELRDEVLTTRWSQCTSVPIVWSSESRIIADLDGGPSWKEEMRPKQQRAFIWVV